MKLKQIVDIVDKFKTPFVQINFGKEYKQYDGGDIGFILKNHNPDSIVTEIYVSTCQLYRFPMLCISIKEHENE